MIERKKSIFKICLILTMIYVSQSALNMPNTFARQEESQKFEPRLIVAWIDKGKSENTEGLFSKFKKTLDALSSFFVRITSPDMPPESRRLWVVSADGHEKYLLSEQVGVRTPRWGKGGYIAYLVEKDTNNDGRINFKDDLIIEIIRETGGTAITIGPGRSPVWSPNGRYIAFLREDEILTFDIISSSLKTLNETTPYGQLIVTNRSSPAVAEDFRIIDMKTKELWELPREYKNKYLWFGLLSNSQNEIVFSNALKTDIFVEKLSKDKGVINVTNDEFNDTDPSWSPNDEYIVYVSNRPIFSKM